LQFRVHHDHELATTREQLAQGGCSGSQPMARGSGGIAWAKWAITAASIASVLASRPIAPVLKVDSAD
jgi:hypothetical protein